MTLLGEEEGGGDPELGYNGVIGTIQGPGYLHGVHPVFCRLGGRRDKKKKKRKRKKRLMQKKKEVNQAHAISFSSLEQLNGFDIRHEASKKKQVNTDSICP